MQAMVLTGPGQPLHVREVNDPEPGTGQVRLQVRACAVCRTDLHILDGELPNPTYPRILGHQIVGIVDRVGAHVSEQITEGDRVGVPWLGWTCGTCRYCRSGRENLCDHALFTGYDLDGGYAQLAVAHAHFCLPIPEGYPDDQAAPLLCAGLIGFRAYSLAGDGIRIGFYGFGSAAHVLIQLATHQGREVYAFTRPGDRASQQFARDLGAVWAGGTNERPAELDAAIIFAPAGALVPVALQAIAKGGIVVCAGIHMSDIPSLPYRYLWGERTIRSVANLTRRDGERFLAMAPLVPVQTTVTRYALTAANEALADLREGRLQGAAVLVPSIGP